MNIMKPLSAGALVYSAHLFFIIIFLYLLVSCDKGNPVNNNNKFNISGIVTNTNGTAIAEANVRLEKAGLTATTGDDGSFTLTDLSKIEQFGQLPNSLAKHSISYARINDIIAVTKDGYLNYRVIVTNSDTSGIEIEMIVCEGTLSDVDGNVYQTVKIGRQVWMAENLKTTRYNDGTTIPLVTDSTAWSSLTTPGYCWYNNDSAAYAYPYGALYNWYTVNTGKLAPAGWHVPDTTDWNNLEIYLIANGYNWDGTTTGNKIAKSIAAKTDWDTTLDVGTIGCNLPLNNRSGLSALPGGFRNGDFNFIGFNSNWWSATERDASFAYCCDLYFDSIGLLWEYSYKNWGLSVRLVKD